SSQNPVSASKLLQPVYGSRNGIRGQAKPRDTVKFELIWNDGSASAASAYPLIFGLQTSISGANPDQSE
ncbi:hypothetical protein, partial [Mesorhizobium sp.]|uniref:hypothetical protein n=1 Tax=Mesorhizobium sp. TaxID=1871066 RepID=UPI0032AEFD04